MGGHVADDIRIVTDARGAGVSRPTIGLGSSTGDEVGFKKSVQAASRVIGHFAKADTAGTGATVLDLHRTGDEDFALMAASAATSEGIVLAAADDLGLVDFDEAGERTAARCYHAAAKFGGHQPGRFIRTQGELALESQGRDGVGKGSHQIGRPGTKSSAAAWNGA